MNERSYIARLKTMDPSIHADAFICQLSTNDASRKLPLGAPRHESPVCTDLSIFDTSTIAGAIEYIIAYAKKTWNCPVIFYTGTRYDSSEYAAMVALLKELQVKWNIGIINLWDDDELNAVSPDLYELYMADPIHPTRAGYRDWWVPAMERYLYEYLAGKR